jgi:glycosyltransferase involved in cell wall biosynthesis
MTNNREHETASWVVMDATPLQSEHRHRGVGTYVRHLSQALARRSPAIRFAMAAWPRVPLDDVVARQAVFGLRPHRPAQLSWVYNEWFLRCMVQKARPEVFHATDFNGVPILPDVATVVTLYDLTGIRRPLPSRTLSERLSRWRWSLYAQRLKRATRVIAISHHVKEEAVEVLGIPESRIVVIPLGVDTNQFSVRPQPSASRNRYFLYVGSLEEHKNVPAVLTAFAHLLRMEPHVQLWLAGPWNGGDRRRLEAQCRQLGIAQDTRLLGHIPSSQLVDLYRNALALVFPSVAEGFGAPIVEAMACGTPVICANFGAVAEVAGDAALTVDVRQPADVMRAMLSIVRHPRLRYELSAQGVQRARCFSWDRAAECTLSVYQDARNDIKA